MTELAELERIVENAADATRWKLKRDYVVTFVLRADRLRYVELYAEHVLLHYHDAEGKACQHQLTTAEWTRLQQEEVIEPLDEVLGAVSLIDRTQDVPLDEPAPEPEAVAPLVLEIKPDEDMHYKFGVHDRVIHAHSARRGEVVARRRVDMLSVYSVRFDGYFQEEHSVKQRDLTLEPKLDLTEPTAVNVLNPYPCPEAALADDATPIGFYYLRFAEGGEVMRPQETAIQALLTAQGIGRLLHVPDQLANDANCYDELPNKVSFGVTLGWYMGRLLGAYLGYDSEDELAPLEMREYLLKSTQRGPVMSLGSLAQWVEELEPGGMTRSRCGILLRLLARLVQYQAKPETNVRYVTNAGFPPNVLTEALEAGFSWDVATPAGYAFVTSAKKAKPLFTPAENRLLKDLMRGYGAL